MKHILLFLTLTAGVYATPLPVSIYTSDGSALYQLNPGTAAKIATHTLSVEGLQSLTFASDGTLYGMFLVGGTTYHVGTINTSNGNVSLLSQIASPGGVDLAFNGLALYEVGGPSNTAVNELDPTTGAATGAHYSCDLQGNGIAFGGDGDVWTGNGFNSIAEYPQSSGGSCTGSGAYGGSPASGSGVFISKLAYANGLMYAIDEWNHDLVSFDGSTFPGGGTPTFTTIGSIPSYNAIAAFSAIASVPEPAALSTVGAGLIGLAGFLYRRRKR